MTMLHVSTTYSRRCFFPTPTAVVRAAGPDRFARTNASGMVVGMPACMRSTFLAHFFIFYYYYYKFYVLLWIWCNSVLCTVCALVTLHPSTSFENDWVVWCKRVWFKELLFVQKINLFFPFWLFWKVLVSLGNGLWDSHYLIWEALLDKILK